MKIWLDAHLSPKLCRWLGETFGAEVEAARDLGLLRADDPVIFEAARAAGVDIVMSKDRDFAGLVERLGPPPRVIWLTVGNSSNRNLRRVLLATMNDALELLAQGETLVEISDPRSSAGSSETQPNDQASHSS